MYKQLFTVKEKLQKIEHYYIELKKENKILKEQNIKI